MSVQAHCYDDGASFTYMPSTGPSLDPSAKLKPRAQARGLTGMPGLQDHVLGTVFG